MRQVALFFPHVKAARTFTGGWGERGVPRGFVHCTLGVTCNLTARTAYSEFVTCK